MARSDTIAQREAPAASKPVEPLTEIETKILDFMVQYLRANTYQPSIREIGERFVGHPPRRAIVNLRQLDFQRAGEIDQLPTQTHQPRQPVPGFARGPCAPLKYPF